MPTSFYRRAIRPHLPPVVFAVWRSVRWRTTPARAVRDWLDLRRTVARLRGQFGPAFVPTVAGRDEMAGFLERVSGGTRSAAEAEYLRSGAGMVRDVERILGRVGRSLATTGTFLEFACGYGRFTRFIVTRLPADRVTSSDIDPLAVAFVGRTFGPRTFTSVADAADLHVDGRYDVIFVASLFSHLALPHWRAWAAKLVGLLSDDGVLLLSVHGPHAYDAINDDIRRGLQTPAPGFAYAPVNETDGRLDDAYYGAAFVTEAFVRDAFDGHGIGRVLDVVPRGLWDGQDVYAVARPAR